MPLVENSLSLSVSIYIDFSQNTFNSYKFLFPIVMQHIQTDNKEEILHSTRTTKEEKGERFCPWLTVKIVEGWNSETRENRTNQSCPSRQTRKGKQSEMFSFPTLSFCKHLRPGMRIKRNLFFQQRRNFPDEQFSNELFSGENNETKDSKKPNKQTEKRKTTRAQRALVWDHKAEHK